MGHCCNLEFIGAEGDPQGVETADLYNKLLDGQWTEGHAAAYVEDAAAQVVFK